MRRLRSLVFASLFLCLCGCTASPYSSQGLTGGYSEQQLAPGTWRVTFNGNANTTQETAQTFWLYRCAEIALQNGYDSFEIISSMSLISDRSARGPEVRVIPVAGGDIYIPSIVPDDSSAKPHIEGDIRLLKRPFAPRPPKSYDAAGLKAALEPLVKGKLCVAGNVCPHAHSYLFPPEMPA